MDFQAVRPTVTLDEGMTRRIEWPENTFLHGPIPGAERDAVILLGVEPNYRWRAFTDLVVGLARDLGVELVVTLGALLADVPHTRPAPSPVPRPIRGWSRSSGCSSRATRGRPALTFLTLRASRSSRSSVAWMAASESWAACLSCSSPAGGGHDFQPRCQAGSRSCAIDENDSPAALRANRCRQAQGQSCCSALGEQSHISDNPAPCMGLRDDQVGHAIELRPALLREHAAHGRPLKRCHGRPGRKNVVCSAATVGCGTGATSPCTRIAAAWALILPRFLNGGRSVRSLRRPTPIARYPLRRSPESPARIEPHRADTL